MRKVFFIGFLLLVGLIYYHYTIVQKHMSDYNNTIKINFITNRVDVVNYSEVTFGFDYEATKSSFKKSLIKSLNEGSKQNFDIYAMLIKYRG